MRSAARTAFLAIAAAAPAFSQATPSDRPAFEAATVKPSPEGDRAAINATTGLLTLRHVSLRLLISVAWKIRPALITGGPAWIDSAFFEVQGKAAGPTGADAMFLMLQTLLEDRFRLKVHREKKEGPVYNLTVAKGGPRLKTATCVPFDPNHLPRQTAPGETPVNYCGRINRTVDGSLRKMDFLGVGIGTSTTLPIESLADQLSGLIERTVIDKTGLSGIFDFQLEWADQAGAAQPGDSIGPSIFTAVQEQLGLKLDSARGPIGYLAVDRAEKPSGN